MTERFERFTMSLSKLNKYIQKLKADGMRQFGLKGVDTLCLLQLSTHLEMKFSQVTERCQMDAALVSRTLKGLVQQGMVERSGQPGKYNATYRLTMEGEQTWAQIQGMILDIQKDVDQGIDPAELEVFYRVLNQLTANFAALAGSLSEHGTVDKNIQED